jgi:hypothetical protein
MTDQCDSILDFHAALRRKRTTQCEHQEAEVDVTIASLTCKECGLELDPWWYLRRMAERSEDDYEQFAKLHAAYQAAGDKLRADYAVLIGRMNGTIERLNGEIAELTKTKNRLWNEQVNDQPLGAQARRRANRVRSR